MEKILITGVTGLLGSAFVSDILRKINDCEIIALVRPKNKLDSKKRLSSVLEKQFSFDNAKLSSQELMSRIHVFECDVSNVNGLYHQLRDTKIDSIFHCAADVNLGKDPDGNTFRNNCRGTENMIELGRQFKVKSIHYVSTAYVSGKFSGTVLEDKMVDNPVFNNSYEKSKYFSEMKIRASGIPYTIYRPSIIVGRRSDGRIRKTMAFYRILEFLGKIKKHFCTKNNLNPADQLEIPLRIESDYSDKVYLVPIDFVQETLFKLFLQPVSNKTFHITGQHPVSTKLIEQTVRKLLKMPRITVIPKVEQPNKTEKMIGRLIGDLFPYFSSQMIFRMDNVGKMLGQEALTWNYGENELNILSKQFFHENFPKIIP